MKISWGDECGRDDSCIWDFLKFIGFCIDFMDMAMEMELEGSLACLRFYGYGYGDGTWGEFGLLEIDEGVLFIGEGRKLEDECDGEGEGGLI